MRNIWIFEDSSKVSFGGGQKMTLLVAEILSETSNLTFVDFARDSLFLRLIREKYSNSQIICLYNKKSTISFRFLSSIFDFFYFFFLLFFNIYILRKMVKKTTVSLSYATTKKGLVVAYMLKLLFNIPYIYHAHLVNKKSLLKDYLWRHLIKSSKDFLCVSQTVFDSIPKGNKTLLYNPSLNFEGYKGMKLDKKIVVAGIGSLIPIKGFEYLVKASRVLPDIEFRIYGDGILFEKFKKEGASNFKLMGFCEDIISEMYSDIDVVVVTTVIEEALSLVLVEAKSVGLPVVTTNIGGQSEIVRDAVDGYKVPVKDVAGIVESIKLLSSDLDLYNKISLKSFESAALFNYETFKSLLIKSFS